MKEQKLNDKSLVKQGMKYSELIKLYPNPMEYMKTYKSFITLDHPWNNGTSKIILTSIDIATQLKKAMDDIAIMCSEGFLERNDLLFHSGSYCHRKIRGRDDYSVHAWGLAVDINAHLAPFRCPSRQPDFIVTIMKDYGFLWGGNYNPLYIDGMHFSWIKEGC